MTVQEGLTLSGVPSFSGTMGFRNRDQLRIALEAPRPNRRTFWEATEVREVRPSRHFRTACADDRPASSPL